MDKILDIIALAGPLREFVTRPVRECLPRFAFDLEENGAIFVIGAQHMAMVTF
jgi:hypothetical protein